MSKKASDDFVAPLQKRLHLSGDKWIEVKQELSVGEDRKMRTYGMGAFEPATEGTDEKGKVNVDWTAFAIGQALAYITDWNLTNADGKVPEVTESAINALRKERFEEIDEAIKAHVEAMEQEKKGDEASSKASPPKTLAS
jgi:hypothetical protein